MLKFGQYNELSISRQSDYGVYLTDGEEEVLLPRKYVPQNAQPGDRLEVFVYFDSEDRPVATTQTPKATVGDIVLMTVKAETRIGAFLDWGIDKDLFVPFREQRRRMEVGEEYVVRIYCDKHTGRLQASSRLGPIMNKSLAGVQLNQEVDLIVYECIELGYLVLVNREYSGMIYHNEIFQPVHIGDCLTGYVSKLRDDGKLDIRLRRPGFGGVLEVKDQIMEALAEAGGFLPLNSQSSPEEIEVKFHMSKKTFKQAIGNLYKERRIVIADDGIRLAEKQ